jgi:hypothetical protein
MGRPALIQPCLPLRVVQDVNVAHLHQLPSRFPGGFTLLVYAVYYDLGAFVGQHLLRVVDELVRDADRTRQVGALVTWPRECLHEDEVVPRSILAFSSTRVISLTTARSSFLTGPALAQNGRSPRRFLHGGPQRREVVGTVVPETIDEEGGRPSHPAFEAAPEILAHPVGVGVLRELPIEPLRI